MEHNTMGDGPYNALKHKIIRGESNNLRTKEKDRRQMINWIKKCIEEAVNKCDLNQ